MESRLPSKQNILKTSKMDVPAEYALAMAVVALVEIREAVEEGFGRLDQTSIEAAMVLVGCKETLDAFLEARLKADKVLAGVDKVVRATKAKAAEPIKAAAEVALAVVKAANESKGEETAGKSAEPVDEPKKPGVTLDIGNFGLLDDGSGKA